MKRTKFESGLKQRSQHHKNYLSAPPSIFTKLSQITEERQIEQVLTNKANELAIFALIKGADDHDRLYEVLT